MNGPTLDEIRRWPATVDPATAAKAFGISRSHAYELVKTGDFPARVITLGQSQRVVTASILAVLGASDEAADAVIRRETSSRRRRSGAHIGAASDSASDGRYADAS